MNMSNVIEYLKKLEKENKELKEKNKELEQKNNKLEEQLFYKKDETPKTETKNYYPLYSDVVKKHNELAIKYNKKLEIVENLKNDKIKLKNDNEKLENDNKKLEKNNKANIKKNKELRKLHKALESLKNEMREINTRYMEGKLDYDIYKDEIQGIEDTWWCYITDDVEYIN